MSERLIGNDNGHPQSVNITYLTGAELDNCLHIQMLVDNSSSDYYTDRAQWPPIPPKRWYQTAIITDHTKQI